MDEVWDFLNKPRKVVKLRPPATGGVRLTKEDPNDKYSRKEEHRHTVLLKGTDYAREIKEKEMESYLQNHIERDHCESIAGGLESLEHLTSYGGSILNVGDLTEEAMTEVYSKYSFQQKEDTKYLPINDYKQEILKSIQAQPVVIIEGPTGCGKTTQVPQWILDDCYQRRKHCKIIVTQPRRIAAISISKRVAQERGWDLGGLVGYQVGLENKTTADTRIHYVTTGILLQKLVAAKTLNEYTHIILDEVHERGQEMDFLLLVVKKLLYTVSLGVKVILMSATFNYEAFANYFMMPTMRGFEKSSWIKVQRNKAMFNVKTFYLNHLHKFWSTMQKVLSADDQPKILPDMYKLVIRLLDGFEHIDQNEDNLSLTDGTAVPSVLVFLPGINEIEDLYSCLNDMNLRFEVAGPKCAKYKWWVLPLHSTITADEQARVFHPAPPGHRKIILSTNIAESSITVPDIKYVVDFCLMKILVADDQTNFTSLQLQWASKTNCEQRAGRAGRVRDGRVYRLVTDKFYDSLSKECPPEICRCPLERLVLLSKMLDMGPPSHILALAMDPPELSNIQRTILVLKEVGALKKTLDGELSTVDGDITYLGRIMAKLPVDVRVSKLIMLGHIFGCLEETIIMAAAMSVKNLFSNPFRERMNAYYSKLTWADGSTSDSVAFLNAYRVWKHLRQQQYFKQHGNNESAWARRFYVQVRALREMDDMVRELKSRLSREGIEPHQGRSPWNKSELQLVNKLVLAGAFYPHYFVQSCWDPDREREHVKLLDGLDPRNTVYLQGFPHNQPGELYTKAVKKIVQKHFNEEPRVTFGKTSSKVFLTFDDQNHSMVKNDGDNSGNPTIPGKVVLPVYKAVKARQLSMEIRVALLPLEKANQMAVLHNMSNLQTSNKHLAPRLPEIDETHIPLVISQFIHCSRFFAQYDDESTAADLRRISMALNGRPLLAHTGKVVPGNVFAAPYVDHESTQMCRVRIHKLLPKDMVSIIYIDYGSRGRVNVCNLRTLPSGVCQELPPLAMECTLAEVAPSSLKDAHGQWTQQAMTFFGNLIKNSRLIGKVYSVSHGVISLELLTEGGELSVNKKLIEEGYAQPCEESYDSRVNHDLRETTNELNMAQKRAFNKQQMDLAFQNFVEIDAPIDKECDSDVVLKGPCSPLEGKLYNMMYAGRYKQVNVEWNSVNSVILDTEPEEVYERLLIAGVVGTNAAADRLTLRHTTFLPNIPGLPAIISLLFCPTSELRRDPSACRYVSALCGLGSTPSGAPLFPEHDILVPINVDFDVDDIGLINHIRHLMDYMMYCGPGQDQPNADDHFLALVPSYIRTDIKQLLEKRRTRRERVVIEHDEEWKSVPEEELLEITEPVMLERAVVYPLHTPLELRPRSHDELLRLKRETDELVATVMRTPSSSSKEVRCTLCGTLTMSTQAMRIHLYSRAHREKLEDFRMFNS